jgi:hypothetical protein
MAAEGASAWLVAIEESGIGQVIRQSTWAYPAANVIHVLGLAFFAAAVVVMDLRLLGAFAATRPADVIGQARRFAVAGLAIMLLSGSCLFIAEASHIAQNYVFLTKMAIVAVGISLALLVHRPLSRYLLRAAPLEPAPAGLRITAAVSLALWLMVAGLGRFIAYV